MKKALRVYGAVQRLVRRLPKDSRPYYAKYVRENFVNYREVDANDAKALDDLFNRSYNHSIWVLKKGAKGEISVVNTMQYCWYEILNVVDRPIVHFEINCCTAMQFPEIVISSLPQNSEVKFSFSEVASCYSV
ncbi:hypothetical protein Ddye_003533 [Dipteronia dyeriana]|uniref:Uncharacterized protein n=1 Tax=Dipteronia dyeriana TaxID=168575 RepID=A0AAE0CVK1_9ROSI|nr:hypothetical protein Ddye_003533 [Dipteronia dyeriana]